MSPPVRTAQLDVVPAAAARGAAEIVRHGHLPDAQGWCRWCLAHTGRRQAHPCTYAVAATIVLEDDDAPATTGVTGAFGATVRPLRVASQSR